MDENTMIQNEMENQGYDIVSDPDYPMENPEDYHDGDMLIAAGIGAAGALGLGVLYQKLLKPLGKKAFKAAKKGLSGLFEEDEEDEDDEIGEDIVDAGDEIEAEEVEVESEVVETKKKKKN